ncbi:MAG: sigma-70 family RNA polymerase sigma factor [Longimonas sp.]|uniref:RNA polymerase sigma factor n=1 Tax=Longimonas sp. TaxID=2039626 RepID=UPI0039766B4B
MADPSTPPGDASTSDSNNPFEQLFRRTYPHLRSYGHRLTTRTALVEDAIQEVFMALWRSDTSVDDLEHPRSYLLAALRRQLIRQLQTERKRNEQETERAHPPPAFTVAHEDLLVAHERRTERQEKVEQALNTLSERRREALYLRFKHGLTHREIAEVMDIAYQTARNYVSEALLHIRTYIKTVDAS